MLFITILLLVITFILFRILWILHRDLDASGRSLQSMAGGVMNIYEKIEEIRFAIANIVFPQENLEKYDIDKAIKTLENIENRLLDINKTLESADGSSLALENIISTLYLIEHSLEIITNHPTFTKHDDDSF